MSGVGNRRCKKGGEVRGKGKMSNFEETKANSRKGSDMARYLDPKTDLTFKKVFGQHKNLVKSLLNALLPLPEGMTIEEVEYASSETIPETEAKKYSIVDVRCTDNKGRQFLVEMQSFWKTYYFARTLFSAAAAYCNQLVKGASFGELKDVYALTLVNDRAFSYKGDDGYMQEFYVVNKNHTDDIRTNLSLIFIELPKYRPSDKGEKKMKELWLKFLTQIDEETDNVEQEMLENEEIYQALQLVRESAFTPGEREAYKEYWLNVSTEKTALEESRKEGREEGEAIGMEKGRKEGREEGRKEEKIEIAKKLKGKGMDVEGIVEMTGLTREEVEGL